MGANGNEGVSGKAQVIGTPDDSARIRDVEILPNVSRKVSNGSVVSRESPPLPL